MAAALEHRAVGDRLTCIFVDTGLMRMNERASVEAAFREHMGMRLEVVAAADEFLEPLAGVADPERKRRIIGGDLHAASSSALPRGWAAAPASWSRAPCTPT